MATTTTTAAATTAPMRSMRRLAVLGVRGRGETQPQALHLALGDDLRLGAVGQAR